jgi:2-oxoglutarate dehydrogenase E2 component (dihydrolipoamide succinyltransferase)
MSQIEILLPKMGESVAEATIIKWLKNEGDRVEADEPIVEIATDKVDSEVPAPEAGVLVEQLVKEGDVVKVGQPIAPLASGGAGATAAPQWHRLRAHRFRPRSQRSVASTPQRSQHRICEGRHPLRAGRTHGPSGKFYSPLVRNIAQSEGVSLAELEAIAGSDEGGRVTKKDILDYLAEARWRTRPNRCTGQPSPAPARVPTAPAAPKISPDPGDELIEMDRMRRLIADHMVMSKRTSPHVTSFVEADVTNLWLWREKVKKAFEQREGEKLTFTPVFIMAIVQAIKEMPMVNVQVDGYTIIKKRDINIGMAAALPNGNLIVPVIKNADQLQPGGYGQEGERPGQSCAFGQIAAGRGQRVAPTP